MTRSTTGVLSSAKLQAPTRGKTCPSGCLRYVSNSRRTAFPYPPVARLSSTKLGYVLERAGGRQLRPGPRRNCSSSSSRKAFLAARAVFARRSTKRTRPSKPRKRTRAIDGDGPETAMTAISPHSPTSSPRRATSRRRGLLVEPLHDVALAVPQVTSNLERRRSCSFETPVVDGLHRKAEVRGDILNRPQWVLPHAHRYSFHRSQCRGCWAFHWRRTPGLSRGGVGHGCDTGGLPAGASESPVRRTCLTSSLDLAEELGSGRYPPRPRASRANAGPRRATR